MFVSLLQSTSKQVAEDLTCSSEAGEHCFLSKACDLYPDLWEYQFKVDFQYEDNYVLIPLATFAVNNATGCEIYVKA